jgi:hypothetical protein
MKHPFITALFLAVYMVSFGQQFPKDSLLYNGSRDKMINLVILPDGYTSAELSKFKTDATSFMNGFFMQSPFTQYKNYFNVYIVNIPSSQSGAKHPHTASDCGTDVSVLNPITYFQSSFDYGGIDRLLVPNYSIVGTALMNNFPQWDIVLVIVNSNKYGGSGGMYAAASTNVSSAEIAIHEIAHSFGLLRDEYYPGASYMVETTNNTKASSPTSVRWKNWVGNNSIGVYSFSEDPSWYRPHQNCKMRYLGVPFCSYCSEVIIERIHSLTNPITNYIPSSSNINGSSMPLPFSINTLKPTPNTLKITWVLDGNLCSKNNETYTLNSSSLSQGTHTLTATVIDTTSLVKNDSHASAHLYSVQWKINILPTDISIATLQFKTQVNAYPNPFLDNLTIAYTLEKSSDVQVDLYDINGLFIKTLEQQHNLPAGEHKKTADVSQLNLPKGLFFLKFTMDNQSFTKSVIKE